MRILVTGGAGFIGSALVRRLAAQPDHEITVLDALTYAGSLDRLGPLVDEGRVRFVQADITDADAVDAALAGHDTVAHLAAETHVDRSLLDADPFHRTNATGTEVLCAAAVRHGALRDDLVVRAWPGSAAATRSLRWRRTALWRRTWGARRLLGRERGVGEEQYGRETAE